MSLWNALCPEETVFVVQYALPAGHGVRSHRYEALLRQEHAPEIVPIQPERLSRCMRRTPPTPPQ